MSTISQSFLDFFKDDLNNGHIPELYVDERIFNIEQSNIYCSGKVNVIDREDFEMSDTKDLKEFNIVNKNDVEAFPVDIEVNSHGIVINSIVLLSLHQWHTIIDRTKCLVCNMPVEDPDGHIVSENHTIKLNEYKPLKKFDLHITRKIGNNYFCAVCNELYNTRYEEKHLESEGHLEKMLYATNRAIDVTYDRCQDVSPETVSHDTNVGVETESGFDSANTDTNDTSVKNMRSYAMVAKQPKKNKSLTYPFIEHVVGNKKFIVPYDKYHMVLRLNDQVYCMICIQFFFYKKKNEHCESLGHMVKLKCCEVLDIEGHFIRKVFQGAHCAVCNVVVKIEMIHAHIINQRHVFLLHIAMSQGTLHFMHNTINYNIPNPPPYPAVRIAPPLQIIHPANNVNQNNERQNIPNANGGSINAIQNNSNQVRAGNMSTNRGGSPVDMKNQTVNGGSDKNNGASTSGVKPVKKPETNGDGSTNDLQDNADNGEQDIKFLNKDLYLRNKDDVIKVSYASLHGLITMGHGKKYCFICTTKIDNIKCHIQSNKHIELMAVRQFLISCEQDLLRQVMLTYHCCICNVLFQKSDIKNHLKWPTHMERNKWEPYSDRRKDIEVITISYKAEETGFDAGYKEQEIKILMNVKTGNIPYDNIGGIFICLNKKLVHISWEAFNGFTKIKSKLFCILCMEPYSDEDSHLQEEKHKKALKLPLEMQYLPSCLRKLDDTTLNCVTCNTNIANVKRNLTEHLSGKRHNENYDSVLQGAFTIS